MGVRDGAGLSVAGQDANRKELVDGSVEPVVKVVRAGPYVVTAVPLTRLERSDTGWSETSAADRGPRYTLCRCGLTSKPPWCDNSHSKSMWDVGRVLEQIPRPVGWDVPASGPSLAVKPNGPIRVRGVALTADDGSRFARAECFSLCRCGQSNAMPFCDGTHKVIGFRG
jgi:CDGSH-type Zn-finger protein